MDFFINTANAQATGATGGQGMLGFAVPVLMLVVFYFLLIRPQNKRAKVIEVGDQYLTLEIASNVQIKLQKFQIAQVLPKGTVKSA